MNYNTKLKKLGLPEYGRNIQNMVDYCVALPDREARRRCADAIIHTMGNLFPYLRDIDDFKSILWNHLAIMSDFKLDIDYPCKVIKKENLYSKPPRIPYNSSTFRYRHYGKIIEEMISKANAMEAGEEKDRLVYLLANQMKKSYVTWNKDSVEDKKIFLDLDELSANRIQLKEEDMKLAEVREIQQVQVRKNPKNNNRKKNHPRRNK
ncbi:MAG: DUF4290 domain-containing protein [Bacteroidales bacterium]